MAVELPGPGESLTLVGFAEKARVVWGGDDGAAVVVPLKGRMELRVVKETLNGVLLRLRTLEFDADGGPDPAAALRMGPGVADVQPSEIAVLSDDPSTVLRVTLRLALAVTLTPPQGSGDAVTLTTRGAAELSAETRHWPPAADPWELCGPVALGREGAADGEGAVAELRSLPLILRIDPMPEEDD